jgi:uncharacterized membrane protein YgcG
MSERYKEVLNTKGKSVSLPDLAPNYGVSSAPLNKSITLCLIAAALVVASAIIFNMYALLASLIFILGGIFYFLYAQDARINTYKQQYFVTFLSPWFKENFGYNLHTFDIDRFIAGIAVIAESKAADHEFFYIFPRYDKSKDEIYVSYVDGSTELNELYEFEGIRETCPRISPAVYSKGQAGLLPENAYFKTFDTGSSDSGVILIAYSSTSDGDSGSGSDGGDSGGGDGGGGGGGD